MKSDLIPRLLTGILFVLVMIAGIAASQVTMLILFGIIVLLGGHEFSKLTSLGNPLIYGLICLLLYLSLAIQPEVNVIMLGIATSGVLLYSLSNKDKQYGIAISFLGALLLPLAFALLSKEQLAGPERLGVLLFFTLLWTNDTFAYLTGRSLGRRKLWERISPKKTWEGFAGGLLFSMLVAYFVHDFFDFERITAMIMAALISTFGTLGDLLESSFKRNAGIKDSGSILPGHGGILDRFDGVMLSAPIVFLYLSIAS